jgi:branched-subunit amino acid transport protein AzlD
MAGKAMSVNGTISFVNASGMISTIECSEFPPMIHSQGLWNYIHSRTLPFMVPLLEVQMILIFTLIQASHYVLKSYGVPHFTTQLLVRALFHFHFLSLSLSISVFLILHMNFTVFDQIVEL